MSSPSLLVWWWVHKSGFGEDDYRDGELCGLPCIAGTGGNLKTSSCPFCKSELGNAMRSPPGGCWDWRADRMVTGVWKSSPSYELKQYRKWRLAGRTWGRFPSPGLLVFRPYQALTTVPPPRPPTTLQQILQSRCPCRKGPTQHRGRDFNKRTGNLGIKACLWH